MQMGKRMMESAKKGGWEEADVLILLTENHPRREKERNVRLDTEVPAGREFNRNEEA